MNQSRELIIYQKPSFHTLAESLLIAEAVRRGDWAMVCGIHWIATIRNMGVPRRLLGNEGINYSSWRHDQAIYYSTRGKKS